MSEVNTAVTGVAATGRGRKPTVLKGGVPLAQARKDAALVVKNVKADQKAGAALTKAALKDVGLAQKTIDRLTKEQVKAEAALAKEPKNAVFKDAVKTAKLAVKEATATHKAQTKVHAGFVKADEKLAAAVGKAEAAKLKVEEAKLSS